VQADGTDALLGQFAGRPWTDVSADDMTGALAVPSMLSLEEGQLYHWLGLRAAGFGASIDLGAFAGGSAARLLSGLTAGGRPHHVHAYDHFTADAAARARHLSPGGVAMTDQNDILPLVVRLLKPWTGQFTLHRGDIATQTWAGGPIEILAIDAAKNTASTDHIAATFFPALMPGRSIVVHQDFLHARQPWLCVQMLSLAAHFVPLAQVAEDCVVFLHTAPVTPRGLRAAKTDGLNDARLLSGVRAAARLYAPLIARRRFGAMVERVQANPGIRAAWGMRNS
jgi:hypothetical protein